MTWRWGLVLAALACAACSSSTTSGGGAGVGTGGDAGGDAAACKAPPYGFPEAGTGEVACTVRRAYVKCTSANGVGCDCISDDPTQCPGCNASTGFTCTNACSPGSFGVSCGGVGPGTGATYQSLPSDCPNAGYTPAGIVLACCPCGAR